MARCPRLVAWLVVLVGLVGGLARVHTQTQGQRQPDQSAQPAQPAPPSDQPAQQPATPTFRTGINFVRVDVIITDKTGNPVSDLKQGDFEVLEDGKPQAVESFRLVSLDGGLVQSADTPPRVIRTDADEEQEAARDDVRLFAIFLDDYHVSRDASLGARQQIARFVETQLGPTDMIGVMYPLEALASIRMTRNHDAVTRGIQQFVGRKYDYTPKNQYEERYVYYPAETVERIRNQVSLSAIKGLITHMATLKEGRKALILVSEGYSNMLPPQLRDPVAALPGVGNVSQFDPQAGTNDPNEDRAAMLASNELQSDLREVYDLANKSNTAIYAVDPRGLATFEFGLDKPPIDLRTDRAYLTSTSETLRTLAEYTDGRAVVGRNDITIAMKQIVRDSSAYYLLGYTSKLPTDGKFHEIKVRVKRAGLQVRSRRGYWAATREDAAAAAAPPKPAVPNVVQNALNAATQSSRARLIRTWIGTERGENGRTRVTFVWEPVPKPPGDSGRASEQPARVSLIAAGSDGSPYFRGRVPDGRSAPTGASPSIAAAAGAPGVGSRVTFDAPPGKMQIRVAVEGAGSEVLDSEIRDLVVPDLTTPQTSLGTPEVFRARTVRELQQVKADPQAMPTAGREFSRTERMLVRVAAYGPGTAPPKLAAKLLNRAGQVMAELPAVPDTGAATLAIEVPLSGLAPGEYVVEVGAVGDGGSAKELVGFRVTS